ncbi:MAG: hypothetical protein JJLCMIEE_00176 [Acidimicrobiales bacterium]|nr:MAG: hypothetical protein EDR02_01150 [Actinomycetota bacterium]MBV6507136.1 hypothetical protein [Acidimicrobiales bacterium]RIK05566.1 MAG: hypothetical protein DCC48_09775 [Acidobacteriota bacterium]
MTKIGVGLAGGFTTGLILWLMLRNAFRQPMFQRQNYRGQQVPTATGVIVALAILLVEGASVLLSSMGLRDTTGVSYQGRQMTLWLAVGMALLGLLDDIGGHGQSGGFAGHLRELVRGRATTGMVKLVGGAALAIAVLGPDHPGGAWALLRDAGVVALAANLGNLFDRAPGRVIKISGLVFIVMLIASHRSPELVGASIVMGAATALVVPDLREKLMLGDAGSNVLGASLGLGFVLVTSPGSRTVALVVLAALNALSEVVSFSRIIDAVPPLRLLDRGLAPHRSRKDPRKA